MSPLARRYASSERGSVVIIAAGLFGLLAVCAALVTDLGMLYLKRREAQGAADLAAVSAVQDLDNADDVVRFVLGENGIDDFSGLVVTLGRYSADASLQPDARFLAGAAPANAVRVGLRKAERLFFGVPFLGAESVNIAVEAIGTATDVAKFAIGSRLLSLNEGIGNAILGQTLGTTINLNAVDYNALAQAEVDLLQSFDALATEADLDAATYQDILDAQVQYSDFVDAVASTSGASADATTAAAFDKFSGGASASSREMTLGEVIDLGPYAAYATGTAPSGVNFGVPALPFLTAAAIVAGGGSQVSLNLAAQIPNALSATLDLMIGEPAQESSWLAVGPEGTSVHTAQMRLGIRVEVGGTGILSAVRLRVPLLLDIASAEGRVSDIECSGMSPESVDIAVTPGLANAWIGDLTPYNLASLSDGNVVSGRIITSPLINVTGRSHVDATAPEEQTLTFTAEEIEAGTVKTVTGNGYAQSLASSLLGDLNLQVSVLGFVLPTTISSAVSTQLAPLAAPLDSLIDSVLELLGIGLGEADVTVLGMRCGGPGLVG